MNTNTIVDNSGVVCPSIMGVNYFTAPHSFHFYQLLPEDSVALAINDLVKETSLLPSEDEVGDVELQLMGNLRRKKGVRDGRDTWFTYFTQLSEMNLPDDVQQVSMLRFTVIPDLDSGHNYCNGRCLIEFCHVSSKALADLYLADAIKESTFEAYAIAVQDFLPEFHKPSTYAEAKCILSKIEDIASNHLSGVSEDIMAVNDIFKRRANESVYRKMHSLQIPINARRWR